MPYAYEKKIHRWHESQELWLKFQFPDSPALEVLDVSILRRWACVKDSGYLLS